MLTVHHALAFLVVGVCLLAAVLALVAYRRRGGGALVSHALALAQTLIVAEVAVGLLLLGDHRRAEKGVHYMYGSLAVLAVAWPWIYAPSEQRRRLAWFAGATLLAVVLAVRAYMTA
jgi:crotonobetainyl-CoA:carnitine CoA-transferase CaiB-like acyl-CoA transferase